MRRSTILLAMIALLSASDSFSITPSVRRECTVDGSHPGNVCFDGTDPSLGLGSSDTIVDGSQGTVRSEVPPSVPPAPNSTEVKEPPSPSQGQNLINNSDDEGEAPRRSLPRWATLAGGAALGAMQGALSGGGFLGALTGGLTGLAAAWLFSRGDYGGAVGVTVGGALGGLLGPLGAIGGALLGGVIGHFIGKLF